MSYSQISDPLEQIEGAKSQRESGRSQEAEEEILVMAYSLDASPGRPDRLIQGLGAEVGQLLTLEIGPELLNGVELGGVGGQWLHHQPRPLAAQSGVHRLAAVGGQPVPHQRGLLPTEEPA